MSGGSMICFHRSAYGPSMQRMISFSAPIVSWDDAFGLVKVNPLATWTEDDIASYLAVFDFDVCAVWYFVNAVGAHQLSGNLHPARMGCGERFIGLPGARPYDTGGGCGARHD